MTPSGIEPATFRLVEQRTQDVFNVNEDMHIIVRSVSYSLSIYLKYHWRFFSCIAGCMSNPIEIKFEKHESR